jgi:hypothetical protein
MRVAAAIALVAIAFSVAVFVHQRHTTARACYVMDQAGGCATWRDVPGAAHPSWEDPASVLIALGSVAAAVGIVASGRRRDIAQPSS